MFVRRLFLLCVAGLLAGCSTVDGGHMGLMFKPFGGGLQREKLRSGTYWTGVFNHVVDFDVTFSTHSEEIETTSAEGLPMTLKLSVIYRPVVEELFELYSEIGSNYYDEVIAPEFKSAARGVFARHSYQDLLRKNEAIEDEVEADLRRRTTGKHVEISSVTLEGIVYAQEIKKVNEARIAAEQDAIRQRTIAEQDAIRQKALAENEDARKRMQIKNQDEQDRIAGEATLRHKQQDVELAKQQSELDRVRETSEAASGLIKAKAEAEERKVAAAGKAEEMRLLARAEAERAKASNQTLTPLAVMMHGYDALKALGGTDTHIMIGDWSKVPNFMFPPAFQNALSAGKPQASAEH
jgi:regulator of protease activity HflC (stomatin/prohibitin superfamily)